MTPLLLKYIACYYKYDNILKSVHLWLTALVA